MERGDLAMASGLTLAPPVQDIQFPGKRFLAPLPLSLFGELEDEGSVFDERAPSDSTKPASTAKDLVTDDEDDEFGDFESVPAGLAGTEENGASSLATGSFGLFANGHGEQHVRPGQVEANHTGGDDFIADFSSVPTAPMLPEAGSVDEFRMFGDFEVLSVVPQVANKPPYDFFGGFGSSGPETIDAAAGKLGGDKMLVFFDDFSSLSVDTNPVEPSNPPITIATNGVESIGPPPVIPMQISAAVVENGPIEAFGDFRSRPLDSFVDKPAGVRSAPMNGFQDLLGVFDSPASESNQPSSLSSADQFSDVNRLNIVTGATTQSGFDPLGVFQFDSGTNGGSQDVIFFSPRAQVNGGFSDDDWGDFVAPPPPVTATSEAGSKTTEGAVKDPFKIQQDLFEAGDLSLGLTIPFNDIASVISQPPRSATLRENPVMKGSGLESGSPHVENSKISEETPSSSPVVPQDASSFYDAQLFHFSPFVDSLKPNEDDHGGTIPKDSGGLLDLDIFGLNAGPGSHESANKPIFSRVQSLGIVEAPLKPGHTRGSSLVERSAAPLSLSLFGEEDHTFDDAAVEPALALSDYVSGGRHRDAENNDDPPCMSSSDSQEETDFEVDEFFLANAGDLHKLTLWLLDEGRVQEALACSNHAAALLVFQALQEDCARALETGDMDKVGAISVEIEAAHGKLAKPQEWHRWQRRRQIRDREVAGGLSRTAVPKLTYDEMLSLLGGASDPRGAYFESKFQSDQIDSLAKRDLRAAAERHTRAIENFQLLVCATVQEQLLYVKAWSALISACSSELELGLNFWQRAVQAESQSHLLTHRKGRNYFAALGQVYAVFLILEGTVRLHEPWLAVAGNKGKSVHRLVDDCRAYWLASGLKDAVYWALSDANESLPQTGISWQGIQSLAIAVQMASVKTSDKSGAEDVCGLSLLSLQTLPAISAVEWGGRQYFLPLANMWANCVESEPPRLPVTGLQP